MALLLNPAPFMPAAQQPHLALSIIYSFQFTKGKSPKSQTSSVLFSTSPNKMWWLLTRVVSVVPSLRTAGAVTVTELWVMKDTVGIQQNRIQGWMGFHLKEVSSSQSWVYLLQWFPGDLWWIIITVFGTELSLNSRDQRWKFKVGTELWPLEDLGKPVSCLVLLPKVSVHPDSSCMSPLFACSHIEAHCLFWVSSGCSPKSHSFDS